MSAEAVAKVLVDGAKAGRLILLPGFLIKVLGPLQSLYAPGFPLAAAAGSWRNIASVEDVSSKRGRARFP